MKIELGMDGKKIWGRYDQMSQKKSDQYIALMNIKFDDRNNGQICVWWRKDGEIVAFFDKIGRRLLIAGKPAL